MPVEIVVYSVGVVVMGLLFIGHTRAFITVYVCAMVLESLITYSWDLVVGGMRIHPQDAIVLVMFLCYPLRPRRRLFYSRGLIRIVLVIAAILFLPALWGYFGGADLRNVARDCRGVVYLMSLLPFISIMRDEEDWQWFLTVFRKVVVVCAYLMLFGLLTGWRLQEGASEGWQTAYSISGEFSRGYGVISSYLFISLALYLDIRCLMWDEWRQSRQWTLLRMLGTLVLAIALMATFVRANVLALFAMMLVSSILIYFKSKRYRYNVWKPWLLGGIAVGVLLCASTILPYVQAMAERAGSIVVPDLGGEMGMGTVSARLRVVPFTFESFEGQRDMILGHGYGTEGLEDWQISALNHNSYFWVIYHGGFLTLSLVMMGLLYLAVWTYGNQRYSLANRIDALAVIVASFSLGASTGVLFGQNYPMFLVLIMLFLAGCNATQQHARSSARDVTSTNHNRVSLSQCRSLTPAELTVWRDLK